MKEEFNIVEAAGLQKVFKDFWGRTKVEALRGATFHVKKGEVFGLLGPNGSGKSTTIKILLGLLKPTSGRVSILGHRPDEMFVKEHVGYLPEETSLYPQLTAEETLMYLGSLFSLGKKECKYRTDQLLEMTGLTHARNRLIGEFSKGMARRIGIAQALINDPQLLVLDEPTSGLDPIGCREVKDLIQFLSSQDKSIIMSSHLLSDVQDVCDYAMILYGGKVCAEGKMSELLKVSELTTVTFPSENEAVLKSLNASIPKADIKVSNPMQSLEELFLQVVRGASSEIESAGAHSGTGSADYLKKQSDALSQYLHKDDELEKDEPEIPVVQIETSMLNALVDGSETEESVKIVDVDDDSRDEINDKLKSLL